MTTIVKDYSLLKVPVFPFILMALLASNYKLQIMSIQVRFLFHSKSSKTYLIDFGKSFSIFSIPPKEKFVWKFSCQLDRERWENREKRLKKGKKFGIPSANQTLFNNRKENPRANFNLIFLLVCSTGRKKIDPRSSSTLLDARLRHCELLGLSVEIVSKTIRQYQQFAYKIDFYVLWLSLWDFYGHTIVSSWFYDFCSLLLPFSCSEMKKLIWRGWTRRETTKSISNSHQRHNHATTNVISEWSRQKNAQEKTVKNCKQ